MVQASKSRTPRSELSGGEREKQLIATEETARRSALDRRIQEYHGATLDEVLELIAYLRDEGDSVLAGGSLTSGTGMGNARSDLDVVIAGQDSESSQIPLEHWLKGLRIDVWKRRHAEIDEVFERAGRRLASDVPFHGAFGDVDEQADLKFLHRIAHGIILDGPQLEPAGTVNYRDVARELVVREYAERMRESAFVAQLAAAAGNSIGATSNARAAVEDALNAAVTSYGLPFTDNKWLRERLANDRSDLELLYLPFAVLPDPSDEEESRRFVRAALDTCDRATGLALSLGDLVGAARWANTDLQLIMVGGAKFLLSEAQGGLWELDDDEAGAWQRLDDSGAWACEDCDEAQMKLCFSLYSQGIIDLRWVRGIPTAEVGLSHEVSA
jgi:hypothetical protein